MPKSFYIDERLVNDKELISDGFCSYFTSIGKSLQGKIIRLTNGIWKFHNHTMVKRIVNPRSCTFTFKTITPKVIINTIKSLNTSKSPGYDNIQVLFLKDGMHELSNPLAILINKCIAQSIFPISEKKAKVKPAYKSAERNQMSNYRPISVLPSLSKVFKLTVHHQLYEYLEENNLLSNVQFGFRKDRSTQHAVTLLADHIRTKMDQGEFTGAVFLDLSKAFDTVDHGCLLSKLSIYGIDNRELAWFESYLFDRKQYVDFDGCLSKPLTVLTGVPQGSILGPLLFILLMNDIENGLKKCNIMLYADDAVLFTSDNKACNIEKDLNLDILHINHWFNENNLITNLKKGKTEFMLFGTAQKLKKANKIEILLNNNIINETTNYEYLGVLFDKSLNYTAHLDRVYKKAASRIRLLSRIRCDLNPHVAEMIFKMMISPIIFYCSNCFLANPTSKFQNLQDRSYKIVYHNKNHHEWLSAKNEMKRRNAIDVFKCIKNIKTPFNFNEYFSYVTNSKDTT
jgi:hypothetical protein